MADEKENLKLSGEQKEKAQAWLKERAPSMACTTCRSSQFQMADHLVSPVILNPGSGGGYVLGGSTYPQIMLVCMNCGTSVYVNAIVAGVRVRKEPPEKEEVTTDKSDGK
ncbi:MAG: hypothetical protein AB7F09_26625 [Parvibaculaceae bacterium]